MTAHMTGAKTVHLGVEMGRDEGKDIERNAVDGSQRVPPPADIRQRGRNISLELRNSIKGEAAREVSVSLLKNS